MRVLHQMGMIDEYIDEYPLEETSSASLSLHNDRHWERVMKEHVRRRWLRTARLRLVVKSRGSKGIEIRSSRMCETDELANEP